MLSISFSPPKTLSQTIQIPSREFKTAIFSTKEGYQEGHILAKDIKMYYVHFYRNENGDKIENIRMVPKTAKVKPERKNPGPVWITIHRRPDQQIKGSGFIKSQHPIDIGYGIGSGINGRFPQEKKGDKYPIYTPLTLHSPGHRKTLTRASQLLSQIITEHLEYSIIPNESLDRLHWLINIFLRVDGFPSVPPAVLIEAITNFIRDFSNLPPGTILRQPINYIFDIVNIDGVCYDSPDKKQKIPSVSFVSTDYEGIDIFVSS